MFAAALAACLLTGCAAKAAKKLNLDIVNLQNTSGHENGLLVSGMKAGGLQVDYQRMPHPSVGATVTVGDFTAGASSGGKYVVTYSVSYGNAGSSKLYETGVSIDDVIQPGCRTNRQISGGGDTGSIASTCYLTIAAAEVLKLEMRGTDGTTTDATITDLSILILEH